MAKVAKKNEGTKKAKAEPKAKKAPAIPEILPTLDKMANILEEARVDVIKFDAGVVAPGRRVRLLMQDIKALAKEIRNDITAAKNIRKEQK